MRGARLLLLLLAGLATAGCAKRSAPAYYAVEPAAGQPMAQPGYAQQPAMQPTYTQAPQVQEAMPPPESAGRGLFGSRASARRYAPGPQLQAPSVLQYGANGSYAAAPNVGGPYAAAPNAYDSATPAYAPSYTLDAGDRLRIDRLRHRLAGGRLDGVIGRRRTLGAAGDRQPGQQQQQ